MSDERQSRVDDPSTFIRRTGAPADDASSTTTTTADDAVDTRTTTTPSATLPDSRSICTPADPPSGGCGEPEVTAAAAAAAAATVDTRTAAAASVAGTDSDGSSSVIYDVCPTCKGSTINGTAVVPAGGKRKADSKPAGREPRPSKKGTVADRSKSRARLTLGQKLEVLELLSEKKMTKVEIAAVFGCSHRTVSSCKLNRATLLSEAASAACKLKSKGRRPAGFPEVDRRVLGLVEAFRKNQIPVGRTTITSFAHAIKTSLLAAPGTTAEKKKLETFGASDKWVKNFVSRSGLVSRPLLLKDGGVVDPERIQESMKEVQEEFKQYDLGNIFSFDERGMLPKRSYISSSESRNVEPAKDNNGESCSR